MERLVRGARKLGIELIPSQLKQFETYYTELLDWNRRINLTAIVDYEEVQIKHFLDSLTVAQALALSEQEEASFNHRNLTLRLIDVGAGAGLPGLPLKIVFPQIKLTLVDSVGKKTAFLNHLILCLLLEDVEVLTVRAEELSRREGYREGYDVAVARGVAKLAPLVELTLPFCRIGGKVIAQKQGQVGEEIEKAQRAIALLGGRLKEVRRIDLEELGQERYLVTIDKVSPTPIGYPRRPGIPSKRPL